MNSPRVKRSERCSFSPKPERVTCCVRQKIQSGKEDATPPSDAGVGWPHTHRTVLKGQKKHPVIGCWTFIISWRDSPTAYTSSTSGASE